MESITSRSSALQSWLADVVDAPVLSLTQLPGAASFRTYHRLALPEKTLIVMDAPPPEHCEPFVQVAAALHQAGLHVPSIIAQDITQGFLLLSDFGDTTYLQGLSAKNADRLYRSALDALVTLQGIKQVPGRNLAHFDLPFMQEEWARHQEWFTDRLLGLDISNTKASLDRCYQQLIELAVLQPQVFMHRDYHSGNLMVLPQQEVGILDFQDALIGPVTYDLVSLLRDCYVDWPLYQVNQWALYYWKQLNGSVFNVDEQTFLRWFDWMGIQRHLKALFTFARKYVRDQQAHYLNHIPRTLRYLRAVTANYPELAPLNDYVTLSEAAFLRGNVLCEQ